MLAQRGSHAVSGGVSSPVSPPTAIAATTSAPTPPTPTLSENLQKGDVGAALAQITGNTKDAAGNDKPGTSPVDQIAAAYKGGQQQQGQQHSSGASAPMLSQDPVSRIAPAAQQLMAQTFAASARPLSWSTTPYGSGIAGPQVPGTTLNGVPSNVYG